MTDGLPSWLLRETERNPRHSHVSVFVGPDADHRALAGQLVLDHDQADDLFTMIGQTSGELGGVIGSVPRRRVEIARADPGPDSVIRLPLVDPGALHRLRDES